MPSHMEKEIGHIENKIYYLYDRGMKFLYQLSTLRLVIRVPLAILKEICSAMQSSSWGRRGVLGAISQQV
jgi:hypothetical protein